MQNNACQSEWRTERMCKPKIIHTFERDKTHAEDRTALQTLTDTAGCYILQDTYGKKSGHERHVGLYAKDCEWAVGIGRKTHKLEDGLLLPQISYTIYTGQTKFNTPKPITNCLKLYHLVAEKYALQLYVNVAAILIAEAHLFALQYFYNPIVWHALFVTSAQDPPYRSDRQPYSAFPQL